jgi:GNAT superfamily N-acetyltransferase
MSMGISGLERHHDRNDFDCGDPDLNTFLARFARQQSERDFNRTYVATALGESRIQGYYAISSSSIHFANLPAALRLPRYPVPVARIGRLGVDLRAQGTGVGSALLQHAMGLALTLSQQIGLFAVVVDAKHDAAAAFYTRYGFARMEDQPLSLYLTTAVIRQALGASH